MWGLRDIIAHTDRSEEHLQTYVCSICKSLSDFVLSDFGNFLDAVFHYNACDTLRNLPEILFFGLNKSDISFLNMHLPMGNPDSTTWKKHLKEEIERLIIKTEKTFNVSFSEDNFKKSIELYNNSRKLLTELESLVGEGALSFLEYTNIIQQANFENTETRIALFENALKKNSNSRSAGSENRAHRTIISGIIPPPSDIIQILEECGFVITGNDIALLSRSHGYSPEIQDVYSYYTDFYTNHTPCTTLLYTADRRIEYLKNLAGTKNAKNILFIGEKFCEYEYFEYPIIQKNLEAEGIKTFFLEIGIDDTHNTESIRTRIEAFSEVV